MVTRQGEFYISSSYFVKHVMYSSMHNAGTSHTGGTKRCFVLRPFLNSCCKQILCTSLNYLIFSSYFCRCNFSDTFNKLVSFLLANPKTGPSWMVWDCCLSKWAQKTYRKYQHQKSGVLIWKVLRHNTFLFALDCMITFQNQVLNRTLVSGTSDFPCCAIRPRDNILLFRHMQFFIGC